MGFSYTPAHRIEYKIDGGGYWGMSSWRRGRPTAANLARHVEAMEASTRPGGCNQHLGATKILAARIVTNGSGETILKAGFLTARTPALMGWLLVGTAGADHATIAYKEEL